MDIQSKEICIRDLPECYAKESLLKICVIPENKVWVVAKAGAVGDWACYIGFPKLGDMAYPARFSCKWYAFNVQTPEQVLSNGDKLDQSAAEAIFPEWKERKWRR